MANLAWDHDEWERWSLRLVREHFGVENVHTVPDGAGGDHGLEAFTTDGIAFQCYSTENEPLKPTARGALQKNKIGMDLKKFMTGGVALTGALGSTIIHTWVLLTPYHEDAGVLTYCQTKAKEVGDLELNYAASPFHVDVHTLLTYESENKSLLGRMTFEHDLQRPPAGHVIFGTNFEDVWSPHIETMDGKLSKLPSLGEPVKRAAARAALLREQVQGGHLLDRWADRVPEVATYIAHELDTAKAKLVLDSLGVEGQLEWFQSVRAEVRLRMSAVTGLSLANAEHVADMAIASWLQECDLDFLPVANDV